MKTSFVFAFLLGIVLSGCTHTHKPIDHATCVTPPPIPKKQIATPKKKNPITVTFYRKGQKPEMPYRILGTETVSKFNTVGIKRQEASIRDVMRNLAASMGGDAVINIQRDDKSVFGTIIAYQDIKKETKKPVGTQG